MPLASREARQGDSRMSIDKTSQGVETFRRLSGMFRVGSEKAADACPPSPETCAEARTGSPQPLPR